MSTMIDVYRHFLGGMASESDADLQARLSQDVLRFKVWHSNAESIFRNSPQAFSAHEQGDVRGFAEALGVPWPVPERVTVQSLAAELDALAAKFKAFAAI